MTAAARRGAVPAPAAHPGRARTLSALGLGLLASGCALQVQGEVDDASRIARYAMHYDHAVGPENGLIDRALADCPEKTAKAETACLRQGIDASGLSVAALVAAVPGCRAGQVCHYDHTTRDRLGLVEVESTTFVRRWRVDLDLRHPPAGVAQVPVTVTDTDDFDAPPPG